MQMLSRRRWSSSGVARMVLSRGTSYMSPPPTDQIVAPPPSRTPLFRWLQGRPEILPPPPDLTFSQKLSSFPPETPESPILTEDPHLPKSAIYTVQHRGYEGIEYAIEAVSVNPMNPISKVQPTTPLLRIPKGYPESAGFVAFGSKIFMIGGIIDNKPVKSVYIYDVNELTFHQAPDMNGAKVDPKFGCVNGLIYVLDGKLSSKPMFESFDPVSMTWINLRSPPLRKLYSSVRGLFVCESNVVVTTSSQTCVYNIPKGTWRTLTTPALIIHRHLLNIPFHLIDGKLGFVRDNGNGICAFDFNLSSKNLVNFREAFCFEESPLFYFRSPYLYQPFGNQMFALVRTGFPDYPFGKGQHHYQLVDIIRYENFEKDSKLPPKLTKMHSSIHTFPYTPSTFSLRQCFPMYEETKATVPNSANMGVEENGRKRSAKREKKNGDKPTQINS